MKYLEIQVNIPIFAFVIGIMLYGTIGFLADVYFGRYLDRCE